MICINQKVLDNYISGMSLSDAIMSEHKQEIEDKISKDATLQSLTPLNMVMRDAKISKYSTVGDLMNTAQYTSGGMTPNEWLFPVFVESMIREAIYGENVLSYLCNTTQGVDGNYVKSATLDLMDKQNKDAIKMKRVAEGADLPIAKIAIGEQAINLWKHGRAIEMTYEAVRRMKIPLFQKHMNAILADIAHQNLDAAVDVLQNGDGNGNKATKIGTIANIDGINGTVLSGILIDYWMENHYMANTMTMNKEAFKKVIGLTYDKNMAAGGGLNLSFKAPQIGDMNVTVLCSDVPQIGGHDAILLSNLDMSLIRYEENGSNIQENQSFARNQTKLMTVSENSGYAINTKGSNRYIEITGA